MSEAMASRRSSRRAPRTTWKPAAARPRAVASPIPALAPVTIAVPMSFTFTDPSPGGIRAGCEGEYDHCHTLPHAPSSGSRASSITRARLRRRFLTVRSRRLFGTVVAMLASLTLLAACSDDSGGSFGDALKGKSTKESKDDRPPAKITFAPADGAKDVSVLDPIKITVDGGELTDATVTSPAGKEVAGKIAPDKLSWASGEVLGYGKTYKYSATAKTEEGKESTEEGTFTTLAPAVDPARHDQPERQRHGRRRHAGQHQVPRGPGDRQGRRGEGAGDRRPPSRSRARGAGSATSRSTGGPRSTGRPTRRSRSTPSSTACPSATARTASPTCPRRSPSAATRS